jgi:hypothetical protein
MTRERVTRYNAEDGQACPNQDSGRRALCGAAPVDQVGSDARPATVVRLVRARNPAINLSALALIR